MQAFELVFRLDMQLVQFPKLLPKGCLLVVQHVKFQTVSKLFLVSSVLSNQPGNAVS